MEACGDGYQTRPTTTTNAYDDKHPWRAPLHLPFASPRSFTHRHSPPSVDDEQALELVRLWTGSLLSLPLPTFVHPPPLSSDSAFLHPAFSFVCPVRVRFHATLASHVDDARSSTRRHSPSCPGLLSSYALSSWATTTTNHRCSLSIGPRLHSLLPSPRYPRGPSACRRPFPLSLFSVPLPVALLTPASSNPANPRSHRPHPTHPSSGHLAGGVHEFISAIPTSPRGKLLRRVLRDRAKEPRAPSLKAKYNNVGVYNQKVQFELLMLWFGLEARSQAKPGHGSQAKAKPWTWLRLAYGSGLRFPKPEAMAQAMAS
ncbi:hypothetical protein BJ912DRAFT_1047716 [Pholiota molesta]|nr:hypothetical protein BJ912DRAFT_1047716 [Pholiota molesta]